MDDTFLFYKVKKALRISHSDLDDEIRSNIEACLAELKRVGISVTAEKVMIYKCCELYCKAEFDFNNNSERFRQAFEKMRDSLSLSSDYKEKNNE